MTEYLKQMQDANAGREARAAAIAAHLPGWKHVPADRDRHWSELAEIDGPGRIWLSVKQYPRPTRLHISGIYPTDNGRQVSARDYLPYRTEAPSINASPDRDPKAIAADITRRFIPPYREALRIVTEGIAKANAYRNACQAIAKELGDIIGEQPGENHTVHIRGAGGDGIWGDARCSDNSAEIHLHNVPPHIAKWIFAAVAEHNRQAASTPEAVELTA